MYNQVYMFGLHALLITWYMSSFSKIRLLDTKLAIEVLSETKLFMSALRYNLYSESLSWALEPITVYM